MVRALLIALLGALVLAFAPSALAAAPTLQTVTQSGGKVSVTWTLPTGGQAWTLEVSKSSNVDSDGYFLIDDVVDTQVFVDGTTSWTSDLALPAGTYYVHLSGADVNCATCPIPQWSAVRTVTVGATSTGGGSGSSSGGSSSSSSGGSSSSGSTGGSSSSGSSGDSSGSIPSQTPSETPQPSDSGSSSSPSTPTVGFGTVGTVTARLKAGVAAVSFRVCGSGPVDVAVAVTRGKASHTAVVTLPLDGCTTYALRLSAPAGAGKASVSVGGVSKQL
jgi:hypothetical protein